MERIVRLPTPIFLVHRYKKWGRRWANRKLANPKALFQWSTFNGERVNHLLLPVLQQMTSCHCSFCDRKELEYFLEEPTIEHFRPKSIYPLLSYYWGNLFLCCYSCQKKNERFELNLLKPDRLGYTFDDFFIIDWITGQIQPRYLDPDPRYLPAINTINLYNLNSGGRPRARLNELKKFQQTPGQDIDDYSYRFFINRA